MSIARYPADPSITEDGFVSVGNIWYVPERFYVRYSVHLIPKLKLQGHDQGSE